MAKSSKSLAYLRFEPGEMRTLFKEVVTVLFAILIAFALDATWDARIQNQKLHDSLKSVYDEFKIVESQLTHGIDMNEGWLDRNNRFIKMSDTDVADMSVDSVRNMLILFGNWTVDPSRGAVDALISSGWLDQTRSPELRTAIAGWPGVLADLDENTVHFWRDSVIIRLVEIGIFKEYWIQSRIVDDPHPSTYRELLVDAVNDDRLKGLVAAMSRELLGYTNEMRDARDEVLLIQDMLEAELKIVESV